MADFFSRFLTSNTGTPSTSSGLGSPRRPAPRPASPAPASSTKGISPVEFTDWMGQMEGTKDHNAQEGQFTYGYGILPATAKALGVAPDTFPNRRAFAVEVYARMASQMASRYPAIAFASAPRTMAHAMLSVYINLGSLPQTTVSRWAAGDWLGGFQNNLKVVNLTNRSTGTMYLSKGLAVRRAREWNTVHTLLGQPRIRQVAIAGTRADPRVVYVSQNGGTLYEHVSRYALDKQNSQTAVNL